MGKSANIVKYVYIRSDLHRGFSWSEICQRQHCSMTTIKRCILYFQDEQKRHLILYLGYLQSQIDYMHHCGQSAHTSEPWLREFHSTSVRCTFSYLDLYLTLRDAFLREMIL